MTQCIDKFKIGDRVHLSTTGNRVLRWAYKEGWNRGEVVGFSECSQYVKVKRDSENSNTKSSNYHPDFWDVV